MSDEADKEEKAAFEADTGGPVCDITIYYDDGTAMVVDPQEDLTTMEMWYICRMLFIATHAYVGDGELQKYVQEKGLERHLRPDKQIAIATPDS